jgi:hypothetical protein
MPPSLLPVSLVELPLHVVKSPWEWQVAMYTRAAAEWNFKVGGL